METRFHPSVSVRVEAREDGTATLSGLGAVFYDGTPRTEFELWPGVVERIMPTFFDRALSEGQDVRGLTNHDANQLLGRTSADTMRLAKSDDGLGYSIDVADTQAGRDTRESVRRGDMTGSSFSFTVRSETWKTEDRHDDGQVEVRELHEIETLYDVGPVTFPAYTATTAGARAFDEPTDARASYDAWKALDGEQGAANAVQKRARARIVELMESG